MIDFEFTVLDFIRENISSPIMDKVMCFFSFLGNAGWIWIMMTVIFLFTKKYRNLGIILAIGLIGSLFIGNLVLKPIVARERPFQVREGINLIISAPHDYSFPSGHTLASMICATIIFIKQKKAGIFIFVIAALIAFSRLYLYVHFPSDVLAGVILGILIGVLSVKITEKYILKTKNE